MLKADKNIYDIIIIGAGMSGLVCGCYLAKAGMKVLIAEQHDKPGGYCTSFTRQGFSFDAAAHNIGSYRPDGIIRQIFEDLALDKRLKILRSNPSNTIITPEHTISYWTNLDQTIDEFRTAFPEEGSGIKNFFHFLLSPDPNSFSQIRSWTFKDLLDKYFTNDKLKTILALPLIGIGGLPPSLMSAFIGAKLFSEFLLDGGYYPEGGMKALPDALAERFKSLGGELHLSCLVKNIPVKDGKAAGVILDKKGFVPSKYVVSNGDARQTFLKLLGRDKIGEEFYHKIQNMLPSISIFVLYLGLDEYFNSLPNPGTTICFTSQDNLDRIYQAIQKCDIDGSGGYMLRVSHDKSTLLGLIPAAYKSKKYWDINKHRFRESFIKRIEKYSIPQLSNHIVYKDAATPYTLHRYTLNYRGAAFGWAGTPAQFAVAGFKKSSVIQGLYLTGHWTTLGLGISGVMYVGQDIANLILRKEKNMV